MTTAVHVKISCYQTQQFLNPILITMLMPNKSASFQSLTL